MAEKGTSLENPAGLAALTESNLRETVKVLHIFKSVLGGKIMATLTLDTSFGNDWPPDTLGGGTITARSATQMTYVSEMGYTVTLRGTGLVYDSSGFPGGGTVTQMTIVKGGVTYASLTGASTDFALAGMKIFGFDRDNGRHQDPNPYDFYQNLMRGDDLINGSAQDDDMRGGSGNDTINGGDGSDYVGDEAGNDVMDGGSDFDALSYDEANWSRDAYRGVNLDAATGIAKDCWGFTDHFSNFERFKDSLFSDTLKGSVADESFVINRGSDIVDGRGGFDRVDYSQADRWGAHQGVTVNLSTGIATDSWGSTDKIANIEEVRGTIFNDTLIGSGRDEVFVGGMGVDVVKGGLGWDRLDFWPANDYPGGHGVTIDLTKAANIVDDGFGNKETATGIESFSGSGFGDSFTGSSGKDSFWGDYGDDTIRGGGGEDNLDGAWGNDSIVAGLGNDHINGSGGDDTLTGNGGSDQFNFRGLLNELGVDRITDFEHGIDNIWIDSQWGGGFTLDHLVANQFRSGAGVNTANSASQRIIYNSTTGDVYFDADGSGTGFTAVKFAVVANHAALTFDDFNVFL